MSADHEPFTVIQISETHVHPRDTASMQLLAAVRQRVNEMGADVVVITGDLTHDGFLEDGVFETIRAELAGFEAPLLVIPGNHDVGDKPGTDHPVRPEHLETWKRTFNDDRFSMRVGRWLLLGINTQLVASGLEQEQQQFRWLDEQLAVAEREQRLVAVFGHAPAFLFEPDEMMTGRHAYWNVEPRARAELVRRLDAPAVRLVATGHLHWHRVCTRGKATWVWCPAVSFILHDACFPAGGGTLGFMRYAFADARVEPALVKLDLPAKTIPIMRPRVELPGRDPFDLVEMVLDFTGTLSRDGTLLPAVAGRLERLAKELPITVMTADTFGTARAALADLPVRVQLVATGADKLVYVEKRGAGSIVAIGNGRNDVPMVEAAAVGIAVVGPEGAAGELVRAADVVVSSIEDAFDLVLNPMRLKATLRE